MDVGKKILKIGILIDMGRFESSFKKRPASPVPFIEIHRIGGRKLLHKPANTVLQLFVNQYMKMIRHQAVGPDVYDHFGGFRDFLLSYPHPRFNLGKSEGGRCVTQQKQLEKSTPVIVINEYDPLIVAAVIEMIKLVNGELEISSHNEKITYPHWRFNLRKLSTGEVEPRFYLEVGEVLEGGF